MDDAGILGDHCTHNRSDSRDYRLTTQEGHFIQEKDRESQIACAHALALNIQTS